MSVRMKLTSSKTGSRRAHHRAGVPRLVATPTGHRRRHFVDPTTGMYRGKQIITIGSAQVVSAKEAKKTAVAEEKSATTKEE
jgi:ribosomal protein L32